MGKRKFAEGQSYDFTDWFTGGISRRTVLSVGKNRVWLGVTYRELDGEHKDFEEKQILKDEKGNEYVLLYIYQDNEARIYANIID